MKDHNTLLAASNCRSDFEIATFLDDIQIDGMKGLASLPAAAFSLDTADADMKAQRGQMIEAVRAGKHLTLAVDAITWRQRPAPNRRGLRLSPTRLADRVSSWKGKPFLIDHNTHRVMESSKGTILSSKLIEESAKVHSFQQKLEVVKPDAVIGFLDGTLRSFSISWFPEGSILCTVHGVDVLSSDSCGCWPLETVMVDGKPKVVEYEFSDFSGKETSGVVVGAVSDTSVEGIRAALSAELGLHPARRSTPKEQKKMAFTRLAAVLGLTELSEAEEARAVTIAEGLRTGKLAAEQERDTARGELTAARKERDDAIAARDSGKTDDLIAGAYRDGKLKYGRDDKGAATPSPREARLRNIAKRDGLDALTAEVAEMDVIVPVGQRSIAAITQEPAKAALTSVPTDAQLAATAIQLGIPVNDLRAQYGMAPLAAGGSK